MHAEQRLGEGFVQLYEYFFCARSVCGNVAKTASEKHLAVFRNCGGFDNGYIGRAVESIARFLRHFRQMAVEIVRVVRIDAFAQVGSVLIGGAHVDGVVAGQHAVHMVVGRGAGENVDLELTSLLMLAGSFQGYFFGDGFRVAGGGEARQAECVAILNHFGRFLGRNKIVSHYNLCLGFLWYGFVCR